MKAYPEYKDSGIEWIGNIPSHWKVSRVKFLSKGNAEYGLSINSESFAEDGVRFIRTTDIDNNGNLIENGVYLPPEEVDESYKLNDGDFLISRSGTIGRAYIHKSNRQDACYAGYLVRFRFLDLQTARFVYWFTKSGIFQMWLDHNRIESTISNVNGQKYANLSLGVPLSGEEIIGVNNFLDRKTAQIDMLIEKKQRQIELLQEQRTALINHAVTKGLNPDTAMKDSGVALCDYNDETGRANKLVSRAQENRHVSGAERQVTRRRHEDRSGSQGQASSIPGGLQVAHSARSRGVQRGR